MERRLELEPESDSEIRHANCRIRFELLPGLADIVSTISGMAISAIGWLGELAGGVDWGILLAVHMGVLVLAFKVTFFHTC